MIFFILKNKNKSVAQEALQTALVGIGLFVGFNLLIDVILNYT